MARVLEGGLDTFRTLAYSAPSDSMMDIIRSAGDRYDDSLTSRALSRFNDIREKHVGFDFRSAKRKMTAAMRKLDSYWVTDAIRRLEEIGEFQHAPSKMVKYLMAEPETRERFYKNRCEGYGERYVDPYPNRVGEDDPVYRKVMDGIWVEDEDGEMSCTEWWETEESALEKDLEFEEQIDIIHSWSKLKQFLAKGEEDPTSPYNGRL